jgi:hypothetical protein
MIHSRSQLLEVARDVYEGEVRKMKHPPTTSSELGQIQRAINSEIDQRGVLGCYHQLPEVTLQMDKQGYIRFDVQVAIP